jgi:rare lipoprotein A (peptidoglycan hydrolase)
VIGGCGSGTTATVSKQPTTTHVAVLKLHPHAIEPVAGAVPTSPGSASPQSPSILPTNAPAPTGPASITSAPAKGAPTNAQVRAAVAQFQLAVARYHLNRLNFSSSLLNPSQLPYTQWNVSIASVYTDYGKPIACGGVLHVPELGVANKTLPCGTQVIFLYHGRALKVPVIDRGPYIAGRTWDLTGATAEALHFPGLGPIRWRIA